MKVRVAARGSRLSRIQVEIAMRWAAERLGEPLDYQLVVVKTRGDIHQDKPFHMIGGKGVFEKEVNLAVLRGEADLAVHSLKDVPSVVDPRLVLVFTPPRDSPNDVIVVREGLEPSIEALPKGAVVGTSSARRRAALLNQRPDLRVEVLRGNVDTRLKRLVEGKYDAIILAEAGIVRLWEQLPEELRRSVVYKRLEYHVMPPAPGQGIIGVYGVRGSTAARELSRVTHTDTHRQARAERAFLARFGGGCHVPVGALSSIEGGDLVLRATLYSTDGSKRVDVEVRGDPEEPELVGIEAAEELRRRAREAGLA